MDRSPQHLARNVTRLSHLDLPGAGQVYVAGDYAYVGHIPNKKQLGTSILDVRDPKNPKVVSQISLDDPDSHSHKARVIGDLMIVNSERNQTPIGRRAEELPRLRARLRESLKREPTHAELAEKLGIKESDIPMVEAAERNPYAQGGFRIYDVKDRTKPKLLAFQKTGGIGVHRFDMDENYAYISTEMEGYVGNILVIYDIRNPTKPEEVSRWWMPGQHVAGRRKALLVRQAQPPAPRAALRQRTVGRLLARGTARDRRLRHPRPAHDRRIQLPPAVPRAFAHLHAGARENRRPAHRGRHRRGRPRPRRQGDGTPPRTAARLPVGARRHRPRGHQAALDLRSERTRFALEPRHARTLRRAPVPGAHERHARLLRVVRRRPADRRHRRPARSARGRLLHPRARRRTRRAADQRRRRRFPRTSSTSSTATPASTCWSSAARPYPMPP